MTSHLHALSHSMPPQSLIPCIVIGGGSLLSVTTTGSANLSKSLCLNNVLVSPQLIKSFLSVH